jgi:hypothetical protein
MPENFAGPVSFNQDNRMLVVEGRNLITIPIKLTTNVATPNLYKRGCLVRSADYTQPFTSAAVTAPTETDIIGVLLEDVPESSLAGSPVTFAAAIGGEFNEEFVTQVNAGVTIVASGLKEILAKRGFHLVATAYGETYSPVEPD